MELQKRAMIDKSQHLRVVASFSAIFYITASPVRFSVLKEKVAAVSDGLLGMKRLV